MYAVDNHATGGLHAHCPTGTMIANKYRVVGQCGTGNFARVFECVNAQTNEKVAVKLLKHGYERDADFECDVLSAINKADPRDEVGVVKLVERFEWRGHAAIVFKLKGAPLRNSRMPMTREEVAVVARDIAEALDFLHFKCHAVHTDLKPENVLREVSTNTPRKWVVCDLGSASFYSSKLDMDLITTRPYRAPEVVMNRGWSYAADTWSFGCILYELRTGRKLFDANCDATHLDLMQAKLGPIPGGRTSSYVRPTMTLEQEFAQDPDFVDLLKRLLCFDAKQRIKTTDVLRHAFVRGTQTASAAPHYKQLVMPSAAPITSFGYSSNPSSRSNSPNTMSSVGSRTMSSNASPVNYRSLSGGSQTTQAYTRPLALSTAAASIPTSSMPSSTRSYGAYTMAPAPGTGRALMSPAAPTAPAAYTGGYQYRL